MDEEEYLERLRRLWLEHWPPGAARELSYPQGEVPLAEYLRAWARQDPDRPAVIFYGKTLSYRDLDRRSDRFAALLAEQGIGPGDRVAVFMPNCPQFHIAFFGILKCGAVHAPVSPMSKAFELGYQLKDSGAKAIVALDQLMPLVREVRAETDVNQVFVTSLAEVVPEKPTVPVPDIAQAPRADVSDAIDLFPALEACMAPAPEVSPGLDDVAALNYTGGTTGMPKGCVHTHRDMLYTAAASQATGMPLSPDSVLVCFFPEFWIAGENTALLFPTFAGSTVVLLARWDPVAFMTAVQRYRATVAGLLVDNAVELMEHPRAGEFELRSLRQVRGVSFVKKLTVDYRRRWREWTGTTIAEAAWGMTETHTSDTFTTGMQEDDFDLKSQPIFVGLPVPGTEFKICDFETGELLPLGSEGEFCVRTPSLLKGYWNKPEETAKALRQGWLHTGDVGMLDEQGFLHFLGRRKEMLKVNGMSVFPAEIEAILGRHPAVVGSGVVGAPDPERGQQPVAFIVLDPESGRGLTESALQRWCREHMAVYKVPRIHIVDSLPLTATGKVRKTELEARVVEER
ncbi:MAG TPA: AMP-binding protein [Gammaproteobacteria bacterium]|nr:AMP-binding protein [Gammaproteobacteria bacterium]